MKKLLTVICMVLIAGAPLMAQGWTEIADPDNWGYAGVIDTSAGGAHGVAVDPDGKVWVCNYYDNDINVFNPDGSHASFSPITEITAGDSTFTTLSGARGITTDNNGNIIVTIYGTDVLRVNYQTGEGMNYYIKDGSTLKPAVDGDGYIYIGKVVGISPITVLDSDFNVIDEITLPDAPGYARGMEVYTDGTGIITGNLTAKGKLNVWETPDFVNWSKVDSIQTNADGDTIFNSQLVTVDWGPEGNLWVSDDNAYGGDQTLNSLVSMNFDTEEYYKVFMPDTNLFSTQGPRGVSFSTGGDTAYVASFNASRVFTYIKDYGDAIGDDPFAQIPSGYNLAQNYPNPFNPTTNIQFRLGKAGIAKVTVYNARGQKVETLMNKKMESGLHTVSFDGSNHPSGLYLVRLQAENGIVDMTREMVLVK